MLLCLDLRKPVFEGCVINKDSDQPAYPRSLICAFVIRILERIISRLASSEISIFELVSVAEQAGLNLTLLETAKKGFSRVATQLFSLAVLYFYLNLNKIPLANKMKKVTLTILRRSMTIGAKAITLLSTAAVVHVVQPRLKERKTLERKKNSY